MNSIDLHKKTILVTGVAGFIGANLVKRLYTDIKDIKVIGVDNMNDYYDVSLKEARKHSSRTSGVCKFFQCIRV